MNFVILIFGIMALTGFAFRSVHFAEHGEKVLAWLTFSYFLFLGRWLAAFWLNNGNPEFNNKDNAWYVDLVTSWVTIAITVISLCFSQFFAALRDYKRTHPPDIRALRRNT